MRNSAPGTPDGGRCQSLAGWRRIENHSHALALYFFWYNWVRSHKAHKLTPAMAAGLTSSPMELVDLVELIDAREQLQLQGKRRALLEAAE